MISGSSPGDLRIIHEPGMMLPYVLHRFTGGAWVVQRRTGDKGRFAYLDEALAVAGDPATRVLQAYYKTIT